MDEPLRLSSQYTVQQIIAKLREFGETTKLYGLKADLYDRLVKAYQKAAEEGKIPAEVATIPEGAPARSTTPRAPSRATTPRAPSRAATPGRRSPSPAGEKVKRSVGRPALEKMEPGTRYREEDFKKWSIFDMKAELSRMGVAVSGKKPELSIRLLDAYAGKPVPRFGQRGARAPEQIKLEIDPTGKITSKPVARGKSAGATPGKTLEEMKVEIPGEPGIEQRAVPKAAPSPREKPKESVPVAPGGIVPAPAPRKASSIPTTPRGTRGVSKSPRRTSAIPPPAPSVAPGAVTRRIPGRMTPKKASKIRLFFGDPTEITSDMLQSQDVLRGGVFDISQDFYRQIIAGPIVYGPNMKDKCTNPDDTAYRFGPWFDEEYVKLIESNISSGVIGIINVETSLLNKLSPSDVAWKTLDSSDPELVNKIHNENHNEVVWAGKTHTGESIPHTVWGHRNASGDIDSLFIEYKCLFNTEAQTASPVTETASPAEEATA